MKGLERRTFLQRSVMAGGGTTTLVINPQTRELVRDFVSLSGTLINCAGGPTISGNSCVGSLRTI